MTKDSNFISLINTQLSQLQQLETIIDNEREILKQNELDALNNVIEQKNQLLIAIEELDQQFAQSPSFKSEKKQGLFDQQLAEIEATLLRCKDKNLINGQVIEQSQLAVERMKTMLLNQKNKSSVTYNSKGKASGGLSSLDIKA